MGKWSKQHQAPEEKPSPRPELVHWQDFRPSADDGFRMKRTAGTLWGIEVISSNGRRMELDPPDTIEAIERRIAALVQRAARV